MALYSHRVEVTSRLRLRSRATFQVHPAWQARSRWFRAIFCVAAAVFLVTLLLPFRTFSSPGLSGVGLVLTNRPFPPHVTYVKPAAEVSGNFGTSLSSAEPALGLADPGLNSMVLEDGPRYARVPLRAVPGIMVKATGSRHAGTRQRGAGRGLGSGPGQREVARLDSPANTDEAAPVDNLSSRTKLLKTPGGDSVLSSRVWRILAETSKLADKPTDPAGMRELQSATSQHEPPATPPPPVNRTAPPPPPSPSQPVQAASPGPAAAESPSGVSNVVIIAIMAGIGGVLAVTAVVLLLVICWFPPKTNQVCEVSEDQDTRKAAPVDSDGVASLPTFSLRPTTLAPIPSGKELIYESASGQMSFRSVPPTPSSPELGKAPLGTVKSPWAIEISDP